MPICGITKLWPARLPSFLGFEMWNSPRPVFQDENGAMVRSEHVTLSTGISGPRPNLRVFTRVRVRGVVTADRFGHPHRVGG